MSTATVKPADGLNDFQAAYGEAMSATTDLRAALEECDGRHQAVALAVAAEREAARVAFVAGREHTPTGQASAAQEALNAAHVRVEGLKVEDQRRQAALADAVRSLVEDGGKDVLGEAIGQFMDAGGSRLSLAVDEIAAARRQLATLLSMCNWLDGARAGELREANVLTIVAGLVQPNGDAYGWNTVEDSLRAMSTTAHRALRAFVDRPAAPRPPRVPDAEMLEWHIAAGGSYSDSTADVRDTYLERGPRRNEAAMDLQDQDTGRTRDQRTWARANQTNPKAA